MPQEEGEIHEEVDPKEEERVFRKAFLDMTEMVRILYQERNEKMEFLDISSLGIAYRYASKIEQKFKQ